MTHKKPAFVNACLPRPAALERKRERRQVETWHFRQEALWLDNIPSANDFSLLASHQYNLLDLTNPATDRLVWAR
jgi:hypothetical protein